MVKESNNLFKKHLKKIDFLNCLNLKIFYMLLKKILNSNFFLIN